jgi:hypothetical protein
VVIIAEVVHGFDFAVRPVYYHFYYKFPAEEAETTKAHHH